MFNSDSGHGDWGTPVEYKLPTDETWKRLESIHQAKSVLGICYQNVWKVCTGYVRPSGKPAQKTAGGYMFRFVPVPDLEGEEWKEIDGITVSNMGRVKPNVGPVRTPVPSKSQTYAKFQNIKFHRLVCRAFHGEPPTPSHTPDHINRNRGDNKASNLRWASKAEQNANMRKGSKRKHLQMYQ